MSATDTPATPPPPARAPSRRSYFSKRANALKAQAKQTDRDAQALASIPVVIGEALDPANTLNSNDQAAASLLTSPSTHASSSVIKRARSLMVSNAEFYVRSHIELIRQCMQRAHIDPRYLDTARRATEFALTNISDGRDRIVDKESNASAPATIQLGIMLGGMPSPSKRLTDGHD